MLHLNDFDIAMNDCKSSNKTRRGYHLKEGLCVGKMVVVQVNSDHGSIRKASG